MSNNREPKRHTILLCQRRGIDTRYYYDFPSITQCMRFIIESFQNELKQLNPIMQSIKYGVNDVFKYIDTFHEYNMLCFDQSWGGYAPYGKDAIKNKLLQYLNSINYSSSVCNKQSICVLILYHHITIYN